MTTRFDEALAATLEILDRTRLDGRETVVNRDISGRISVGVDDTAADDGLAGILAALADELKARLGAFAATRPVLRRSEMTLPELLFSAPDAVQLGPARRLVEREVTGAEWSRPAPETPAGPPRFVFYGFKGGTGRSTALAVLARHWAEQGLRIAVVDLDLESPGLGSLLLPDSALCRFGVVDWLVEDAVGQADDSLVGDMCVRSAIAQGTDGRVWVVPASGAAGGRASRVGAAGAVNASLVEKLSRAYTAARGADGHVREFGERLSGMLGRVEGSLASAEPGVSRPLDAVLVDARTGVHDLAAVALVRLGAWASYLFAVDSRQTWQGYRALFGHMGRRRDTLRRIRESLRLVAALVPDSGREAYLASFRAHAYDECLEGLYDVVAPGSLDDEAFSPAIDATDAPHSAPTVLWGRQFQAWNPVEGGAVTAAEITGAYGSFLETADRSLRRHPGSAA